MNFRFIRCALWIADVGLARQSHLADPELLFVHIYQNARQLPKMPRQLVNRDEQGRLIAQTSGAITMIDDSHYEVRSMSSGNTYTLLQLNLDGLSLS